MTLKRLVILGDRYLEGLLLGSSLARRSKPVALFLPPTGSSPSGTLFGGNRHPDIAPFPYVGTAPLQGWFRKSNIPSPENVGFVKRTCKYQIISDSFRIDIMDQPALLESELKRELGSLGEELAGLFSYVALTENAGDVEREVKSKLITFYRKSPVLRGILHAALLFADNIFYRELHWPEIYLAVQTIVSPHYAISEDNLTKLKNNLIEAISKKGGEVHPFESLSKIDWGFLGSFKRLRLEGGKSPTFSHILLNDPDALDWLKEKPGQHRIQTLIRKIHDTLIVSHERIYFPVDIPTDKVPLGLKDRLLLIPDITRPIENENFLSIERLPQPEPNPPFATFRVSVLVASSPLSDGPSSHEIGEALLSHIRENLAKIFPHARATIDALRWLPPSSPHTAEFPDPHSYVRPLDQRRTFPRRFAGNILMLTPPTPYFRPKIASKTLSGWGLSASLS